MGPRAPPKLTPVSFPITCEHTIIIASHCVGFTFPGMMLPQVRSRVSLALRVPPADRSRHPNVVGNLQQRQRHRLEMPLSAIWASCAASDSNLLGADTNGRPVSLLISAAIISAYSGWELRPVPTAVPPMASSVRCTMEALRAKEGVAAAARTRQTPVRG